MARKKKTRSSNASNESPLREASVSLEKQVGEADVPPEDWLELRVVRPASGVNASSKRDAQKPSLVWLTDEDAYRIDVVHNDPVLLLARHHKGSDDNNSNTNDVSGAIICAVRVIPSGETPGVKLGSSISSPPTRKAITSSHGSSIRLSTGTCQLSPISLWHDLFSTAIMMDSPSSASSTPVPATLPCSPSPTTPTGFSFARGGGGDLLISPATTSSPRMATTATTTTPLRTPSRNGSSSTVSQPSVWVIPMHSAFGERVSQLVCQDSIRIHLSVPSSVPDLVWNKAIRVLQRLVLATHAGHYFRPSDVLGISFQGKPLLLTIDSIEGKKEVATSMEDLDNAMASIHLDASWSPEQGVILEALFRGWKQSSIRKQLELFQLTYETQVVLSSSHDEQGTLPASQLTVDSSSLIKHIELPKRWVAGLDATIEQVQSMLLPPILRPELFSHGGALRAPRGVLLHGPSGVGKSVLAKQIAADLPSTVHVELIHCSSLQSSTAFVGQAERQLTRLFSGKSPSKVGSVLIFDDIHLICPKRGGNNNASVDRLAATLLALLDGIDSNYTDEPRDRRPLLVLAITANPSLLDPALRRPGRLDAEVEIPIPDEQTRAEILKFQLECLGADVKVTPPLSEADIVTLSRLAKGFNGADCMLAIKDAIRRGITAELSVAAQGDNSHVIPLSLQHLQSSIRATKPSTISSLTVEIPPVHWNSIGGMDFVKQQLREAIELPMTHAHLFQTLRIPPPRGVLLYGPPGCSKTLMARALATEGQMNFLAVKGPELLSKWLGESERALASLFRRARMASPCIIFFDEIDAIASKRGGGDGSAGGERLLSQLLTELDGVGNPGSTSDVAGSKKTVRVVVVGATNRPDLLDSALTRPGRIDRKIYVGLPDQASRERIFEIGLKGKACSSDIEISILASDEVSDGYSGAELIAICRDAALFAIEEADEQLSLEPAAESLPMIGMRHLFQALKSTRRQITTEMLEFYASYSNKTFGAKRPP